MSFTIGKLAKNAGINVETIRYYERKGLIQQPPRINSGYRQYSQETLNRVRFIRTAKTIGFSLGEIAELMDLMDKRPLNCDLVEPVVEKKMDEIEEKMRLLKSMRQSLAQFKQDCQDGRANSTCIIEDLYQSPGQADEVLAR